MASVKCPGCARLLGLKKLEGAEGFAVCPKCHTVFDVSPAVESAAPRNAPFWSHDHQLPPLNVTATCLPAQAEQSGGAKGYRSNARVEAGKKKLVLTCRNRLLQHKILLGGAMTVAFSAGLIALFLLYGPGMDGMETWVWVSIFVCTGFPLLLGAYLTLVGIVNRVYIDVDDLFIRIKMGPLPFLRENIKIPVADIEHVICNEFVKSGGRGVTRRLYPLEARLLRDRRKILIPDVTRVESAMFLQHQMTTFLGLASSQVGLLDKDAASDERQLER